MGYVCYFPGGVSLYTLVHENEDRNGKKSHNVHSFYIFIGNTSSVPLCFSVAKCSLIIA